MDSKEAERTITEDEAALYDRQIRLWGLDAQRRLRGAKVLIVGMSGLGAEVAKNIILSGVKSVTLLDSAAVSKVDSCSQFLVSREDVGKNRAEASIPRASQLNPMVEVNADTTQVSEKADSFFTSFDIVCATCCQEEQLVRINKACRSKSVQFYAGDVFGYYSFMFADLGHHEYAEEVLKKDDSASNGSEPAEKKAKKEVEMVTVKKAIEFAPLDSALEVDWDDVERKKSLKRTPSMYFIMKILLEFRKQYQRKPDVQKREEDKKYLQKLRTEVMEKEIVDVDKVPESFAEYCFAELSPVCAILGGVLSQEIIKAVSQKDKPHNNFFFFNGVDGSGMVDYISTQKQ